MQVGERMERGGAEERENGGMDVQAGEIGERMEGENLKGN
jgi:hypothetical protein